MGRDPWTVARLVTDLRQLGVSERDVLMVHASLRRVGPVDGGAAAVIDALETAIGADGTLLMTLGAVDGEPFDCLTTAADPDVGVLAEVFRASSGTVVSDHPEGRFGARGRLAEALVRDVPWDDYYGPDSPLERFVRARGRVLRLGADIDTVTLLHFAEYCVPLAGKRRVVRHPTIVTAEGLEVATIDSLDDSHGIVDHPGDDYFGVILREFIAAGGGSTGVVGDATGELFDAADFVDFGVAWMAANLDLPEC